MRVLSVLLFVFFAMNSHSKDVTSDIMIHSTLPAILGIPHPTAYGDISAKVLEAEAGKQNDFANGTDGFVFRSAAVNADAKPVKVHYLLERTFADSNGETCTTALRFVVLDIIKNGDILTPKTINKEDIDVRLICSGSHEEQGQPDDDYDQDQILDDI